MFFIYHELIKAKLPVPKKRSEDRHLWYLWQLDNDEKASVSPWKEKWERWKAKHKTKDPEETRR